MNNSVKRKKIQIGLISASESQVQITIISLIILYFGLLSFLMILRSIEVKTTAQVSQHWRGVYDLLIRPQPSITSLERELQMVEGNYLGAARGGISEEQYEWIKSLPDVEIAAPISTIGFMMNDLGSIAVKIEPYLPNTLYELKIGWHGEEAIIQDFPTVSAYFAEGEDDSLFNDFLRGDLSFTGSGMLGKWVFLNLGSLPPQWILVAGIDPEAEAKLIGLDSAIEEGSYLKSEQIETGFDQLEQRMAAKIPLIVNRQTYVNLGVDLKVRTIPIQAEDILKLKNDSSGDILREKITELDHRGKILIRDQYELLNSLRPLMPQSVIFSVNQPPRLEAEGGFIRLDSNIILRPGIFEYDFHEGSQGFPSYFSIRPYGRWEEIIQSELNSDSAQMFDPTFLENLPLLANYQTVFRSLESIKPPPFIPDVKGVYNIEAVRNRIDPISYVPLGIYEPPQEVLRYDEDGNPVEAKFVTPSLNPGGFNPRPPLALTTLEAAQYLIGRPDYIDAIRVRIRDISGYSPENVRRVERIASEIQEKTGLHVDIVAGSSPRKILLFVPGIGYVEENWTSLGLTQYIESGLDIINLFLVLLLLLSVIFLILTNTNLFILSKLPEIGLLKALGWENDHIIRRLVKYQLLITVWGVIPLTILIFPLSYWLNLNIYPLEILAIGGIVGMVSILSSFPVIVSDLKKKTIYLLKFDETSKQRNLSSANFNFKKLVLYQLRGRMRRSLLNGLSFGLTTFTFHSVINIWVLYKRELELSLLGTTLIISLSPYYVALALFSLMIGLLIVIQNIGLNVRQRESDLKSLLYIGWDKNHLFKLVFYESFLREGIFGIIGGVLGVVVVSLWKDFSANILIFNLYILGFVLLLTLTTCWFGTSKAIAYLRLPTRSSSKNRILVIPILVLLTLLLGILIFAGEIPALDTTFSSMQATIVPDDVNSLDIDKNRMVDTIENLSRIMESPMPGSTRAERVADILHQQLSTMGLTVNEEWVPYQTASLFNQQQNLLFQFFPYRLDDSPLTLVTSATHLKLNSNLPYQRASLIYKPIDQVMRVCDSLNQRWLMLGSDSRQPAQFINPLKKLLENNCPLPLGFAGVAIQDPEEKVSDIEKMLDKNVEIEFYQARIIKVTIPGTVYPEKEIWVTTHYDAKEGTPAADLSLSGTVTLMELARKFSESGTPYTLHFLWFPGLASQYSGLISYIQNHKNELPSVVGVIDISQSGNWQYVAVDNDMRSPSMSDNGVDFERVMKEGQYIVRDNWMMTLNLDDPDLLEWMEGLMENKMGLSESPEGLRNSIIRTGDLVGVSIRSTNYTCQPSLSILLSANLPSLGVCGAGNEFIGSSLDHISTIDKQKLFQFTSFSYIALQNLMSELK